MRQRPVGVGDGLSGDGFPRAALAVEEAAWGTGAGGGQSDRGGQLVSRAPTAVGDQMILDEGQEPQLFPAAMATRAGRYELFSLWWPTRSLRSRSTRPSW